MDESFSIIPGEPLHEGMRRILQERTQAALSVLAGGQSSAKIVHELRKRLKELRAGLRLVRSALEPGVFAAENAGLRDLARPLSAARDADVMIGALRSLKKHFDEESNSDVFHAASAVLRGRRKRIDPAATDPSEPLKSAASYLRGLHSRLATLAFHDLDRASMGAGLERTYRQGRRAMRTAFDDRQDESLHRWRKRTKDLRYQLTILRPLWPELLEPLVDQTHALGGELGDDHDLVVLLGLLDGELRPALAKADRQALRGLIARRRKTLQHRAKRLGRRVYAEKPKGFIRRIHAYWRSLD